MVQEFKTRVAEIKYLTQHTMELSVDLIMPESIGFKAGQFMQFVIGQDIRNYSIISIPDHNQSLKFCIELVPQGLGSNFVKQLKQGSEVIIRGPWGNFTFDRFDRSLVCVATGVGIAPFVSLLPDALSRGFAGQAVLLFGVRSEDDIFYFDRFSHMAAIYQNFKFIPVLTQPQSHWPGSVGRVTTFLDLAYQKYGNSLVYICGGNEMYKDVADILHKHGHNEADIKAETFF